MTEFDIDKMEVPDGWDRDGHVFCPPDGGLYAEVFAMPEEPQTPVLFLCSPDFGSTDGEAFVGLTPADTRQAVEIIEWFEREAEKQRGEAK